MMRNPEITAETASHPSPLGWKALLAGASVVGIFSFYWTGLASLPAAWERQEYSHGYLIPLIALYIFFSRLPEHPPSRHGQGWFGLSVIASGLLLGLLGNLSNIADIVTYGLILSLAGMVFVRFRWQDSLQPLLAVAYLIFMLPLPNFIYWPLSIKLQLLSSELGVSVISLFGIPVYLDGNIIDLGVYQLQVAEACSGLRYLFPLASFSFLFAVLYRGPWWHRAVIFVSAMPITVFMNAFRIGVIGVLVDRYGIKQAEGFLHVFEGWIIFIACIGILYAEAAILQRLRGRAAIPLHRMLEVDFGALGKHLNGIIRSRPSRSMMVVAAGLLLFGVAWQLAPSRPMVDVQRDSFGVFPLGMGEWTGKRVFLDSNVEAVLKATDYFVADYDAGRMSVDLLIAYYASQTAGSGIHSPEVCLPTGGWEVSRWTRSDTGLTTAFGQPLRVNRAIIQKGAARQLVYYWFEQRGRALTSDYAAKLYTVLDSLIRGRTDGALVRVITPIDGRGTDDADRRLTDYLKLVLPKLPRFLPG